MHRKSRTSHACAGHFAPGRVAYILALPVNPNPLFPVLANRDTPVSDFRGSFRG
jgi:hypothetical protein